MAHPLHPLPPSHYSIMHLSPAQSMVRLEGHTHHISDIACMATTLHCNWFSCCATSYLLDPVSKNTYLINATKLEPTSFFVPFLCLSQTHPHGNMRQRRHLLMYLTPACYSCWYPLSLHLRHCLLDRLSLRTPLEVKTMNDMDPSPNNSGALTIPAPAPDYYFQRTRITPCLSFCRWRWWYSILGLV